MVGYFRASGFYLMEKALDKIEKTRILIGINTDKKIIELYEEAQGTVEQLSLSNIETIDNYKDQLEKRI